MQTSQRFRREREGRAISRKGGERGDTATLVFEKVGEGLLRCFTDRFESFGEGEFDVARCRVDAMGDVGNIFDDFVSEEAVGGEVGFNVHI